MDHEELIKALRQYSPDVVAYKLDAAFAYAVDQAADRLAADQAKLAAMRNELCQRCGRYKEAHLGACDGCRWKEEA